MSASHGERREQEKKKCNPYHDLLCFLSAAASGGGPSCNSSPRVVGAEGRNPEDEKERMKFTCNVAREIVSSSEVTNGLLGGLDDDIVRAQVDSWLEIAVKALNYEPWKEKDLQGLNAHLATRVYIAGSFLTLADVAVYFVVSNLFSSPTLPSVDIQALGRWHDVVSHGLRVFAPGCKYLPQLPSQAVFIEPVVFPLPGGSTAGTHTFATREKNRSKGGKSEHEKSGHKASNREIGKQQNESNSSTTAIPTRRKGDSSTSAKVKITASSTGTVPDPSNLDIRVGMIVKVWPHPESEKLWCEEIDIGEKVSRVVLSGLRAHYKEEELMGAKVAVLANLRARKMGGLKSEGMLMCASNTDHTVVKIIVPPERSKPGDRILFQGLPEGAALTPSQVEKKKIFVNCLPYLKTNDLGVPGFNGADFHVTDVGTCLPLMPNAAVS